MQSSQDSGAGITGENVFLEDERVGRALLEVVDAAERWIAAQPKMPAALE